MVVLASEMSSGCSTFEEAALSAAHAYFGENEGGTGIPPDTMGADMENIVEQVAAHLGDRENHPESHTRVTLRAAIAQNAVRELFNLWEGTLACLRERFGLPASATDLSQILTALGAHSIAEAVYISVISRRGFVPAALVQAKTRSETQTMVQEVAQLIVVRLLERRARMQVITGSNDGGS